jgi:hypothetical protein
MSDKRKFKISIKKAKTVGGTEFEKVELPTLEVELGDKKEETFDTELTHDSIVYKVKGKVKKGYM